MALSPGLVHIFGILGLDGGLPFFEQRRQAQQYLVLDAPGQVSQGPGRLLGFLGKFFDKFGDIHGVHRALYFHELGREKLLFFL